MKYLKLFENYNTIYKGIPVDEVKDIFTDFLDRYSIHDCEFFIQDKNELFREIICENPNLGKREWSGSGWNPNSKDFMQTISVIIRLPESRRSEKFCDSMNKLSYNIWAGEDKIISTIIDRMLDFFDFKFVDLFAVGGTDVIFTFVKNEDWLRKMKSSEMDTKAFESIDGNLNADEIKSCFDEISFDDFYSIGVNHLRKYDFAGDPLKFKYYTVQIIVNDSELNLNDDDDDFDNDFYLFDLDEKLKDDIKSGIGRCEELGYIFSSIDIYLSAGDPGEHCDLSLIEFEEIFEEIEDQQVFCIYVNLKMDKLNEEIYYPDLSPHYTQKTLVKIDHANAKEFLRRNNYVNIGWLEPGHDFPKGDVDPKLVDKIKRAPVSNMTKGWHNCLFCDNKEDSWAARSSKERKIPGKNGISYCYPDMLAHYIEKHNYLPPQEFLDAVEEYEVPEEPKKVERIRPKIGNGRRYKQ